MTQQILSYFQIGVAVFLGAAILLQQKGQGLSGAFGGEGGFYRTKRGIEKTLLIATIVLAALFIGLGITRVMYTPALAPASSAAEQPTDVPSSDLGTKPNVDGSAVPLSIPNIEVEAKPVSQ